MPWRQLLLESRAIAVISATAIALLAFPGTELAKSAQPHLARVVTPAPEQPVPSVAAKGPEGRLTGNSEGSAVEPVAPKQSTPAPAPATEVAAPPRAQRSFDGCLHAHEQSVCRRAFEAAIERQGGFTMMPAGDKLGSQRMALMPALTFDEAPHWRRRIESLSEQGIAFKRLRRGNDHELLIGITPEGVLGFSLEERPSGR
jgi:hypothetical protein